MKILAVRCLLIGWLCRWSCLNGCCWCVMCFCAAKSGCWLVDCALCRWSCWWVAADRLIVQVVPLKSGCWLVNCAGGVTEWWSLIGWLCRWCCWRVDADWLIVQSGSMLFYTSPDPDQTCHFEGSKSKNPSKNQQKIINLSLKKN